MNDFMSDLGGTLEQLGNGDVWRDGLGTSGVALADAAVEGATGMLAIGPGGIFNPAGDALNEAYLNATKPYVGSYRCSPGYGFSKGAWGVAGAAAGGAAGLAKAGMCAGRAAPMFKGSSRTCFVAGTPVLMADGSSKAIEEVKAGDKVLSKDEASGKIVAKEVVSTKVRTAPSTLVIEVEGGTRVETTPEHPFYVEGTGWTPAGRLAIGNAIVTRAGPSVKIVRIETKETPATVYNFEVADTHSYFVGCIKGSGVWVHNQCQAFDIGDYSALKRDAGGTGLEIHHLPQAHLAEQTIPGYARRSGLGIALPARMHQTLPGSSRLSGNLSNLTAAEIRARVSQQLRDLQNAGVPRAKLQELASEMKIRYPSLYQ
jgi:hypothetical protein